MAIDVRWSVLGLVWISVIYLWSIIIDIAAGGMKKFKEEWRLDEMNEQMNEYKKGPYGPEPSWHFGTQLAKNTQLSLNGPHVKAYMEVQMRSKEYMNFEKMLINFIN